MQVPIVRAAIMPHGDALLPSRHPASDDLGAVRRVLGETGRSISSAPVDAVLLLSPHHLRIRGQISVTSSAFVAGTLPGEDFAFNCRLPVARELSARVARAAKSAAIPAAEVNYATADGDLSCLPLDWGSLIPLYFLTQGGTRPVPVCVVGPPRDLGLAPLVSFGRALREQCADLRVALIASADLGHAHAKDGPYGFHPAAAQYDGLVQDAVMRGDLAGLQELDPGLIDDAKADAPWQLAILFGALGGPVQTLRWAYTRPTYFGMLAAEFAVS